MARITRGNRDHVPRPLKNHVFHITLLALCFQFLEELQRHTNIELREKSSKLWTPSLMLQRAQFLYWANEENIFGRYGCFDTIDVYFGRDLQ